jgi:glycosyltransferase involved in cell wall biosynthesis
MDVAFFHHYSLSFGGGGERFIVELSNFLVNRGHSVEVHALPFRRRKVALGLDKDVPYCEKWIHRSNSEIAYLVYAPTVARLFRHNGPEVAGLHGAVVMDFESPPKFYFRQGPLVASAYILRRSQGSKYLIGFDAVHTVSPVSLSHPHLYILPNWVNCSHSSEALELKKRKSDTFTVLYVGKPSYTKGFDLFAGVSELSTEKDIRFVAVFPPDPNFNGQGKVEWIGHIPHEDIWKLYAGAAVLLHPTRQESFGRVILESLAAGTPVITTPIPSHQSLGLSLEYASSIPEMWAKVHDHYVRWKTDYDGYIASAQSAAESIARFDSRVLLPQYEGMLREVLANGVS